MGSNIVDSLIQFWQYTGFANMTIQHVVMIAICITSTTMLILK